MNIRIPILAFMLLLLATPVYAKFALLVGVSKYEHPRLNETQLKFPEEDAKAMAELLEKSVYQVLVLTGKQATAEAIRAAMARLAKQGDGESVLLLGFFGHGVQYGESAYYCPYDTDLRVVKDADGKEMRDKGGLLQQEPDPDTMVSMRQMLDTLTVSKAGSKLLLADCCREDPSRARGGLRGRAFGEGLEVNQLPSNCAALFACRAGEQAYEHDDWQHGAFTRAFLDVCESRTEVTANELSALLYRRVNELVGSKPGIASKQTVSNVTRDLVDLKLERSISQPKSFVNSVGATMMLIPAGSFMMGSPDSDADAQSDEKPQHRVTISRSYYLGETEVTQGQWKAVMGTEPWKGKEYVREGANYPATYVSWEDAVKYCGRLSEKEGREYRLPTEAEWEYACRGGASTRYSFSLSEQELLKYAWFDENAWGVNEKYAHLVKQKQPNGLGLYDMHGNVWEWCSDWRDDYSGSPLTDPRGPSTGSIRVNRGGSWGSDPAVLRATSRGRIAPDVRSSNLGFRVASSSVR